jgi:hypothetical protein
MTLIALNRIPLLAISLLSLVTAGCSANQVRDQLGLTRESPDEFSVVRRAPLEIPKELLSTEETLPKPELGAARPQESAPDVVARQTLLGVEATQTPDQTSAADQAFLQKTGTLNSEKNIRARIDQETEKLHDRNKPVAERLLGIGGSKYTPSASVVNATEESKRLRENIAEGKSITDGETPSIEE